MDNLIVSKNELVVLLDLLQIRDVVTSIGGLSAVSRNEYNAIKGRVISEKKICQKNDRFLPDKKLLSYLRPISDADMMIAYNYGVQSKLSYNVSIYISEKRGAVIKEKDEDNILIVPLDEYEDLMLALEFLGGTVDEYISYVIGSKTGYSEILCAKIIEKNLVSVVGGKREKGGVPNEIEEKKSVEEFNAWLKNRFKEAWDVSGS